jgi:hypothetical protein
MKKTICVAAALGLLLMPGCSGFDNLRITYNVYSTASNASSMPDAAVIYRDSDGTDHTTTIKVSTGWQYTMVVTRGTHINLRATTTLPAYDGNANLLETVSVFDTIIVYRECDCSNGIAATDGSGNYKLICDFQGEAIGITQ